MADSGESSSGKSSWLPWTPWWAASKEDWSPYLKRVRRMMSAVQDHEKPLPAWTTADVEAFAKEEPEAGEQVILGRQAAAVSTATALTAGLASAAYSYRYSRSGGAAALTLIFATLGGWVLGEEAATIGLRLYKVDTTEANAKFLEWWKAKQSTQ